MMESLKEKTLELIHVVNGEIPGKETTERVKAIIEENDLQENAKVPGWILSLFENIIAKKVTPRIFFRYDPGKGDTANFIAELEDLLSAEVDDYGEAVEIKIARLALFVCISTEGNFYEIKQL